VQGQTPSPVPAAPEEITTILPASLTPEHQAVITDLNNRSAAWGAGHMVTFSGGEIKQPITLYDKTGKLEFTSFPDIKDAKKTFAMDAVVAKSGNAILALSAVNGDGGVADMIAEMDANGTRRIVRTNPFYPYLVCSMDDGTVWSYGIQGNAARDGEDKTNYPMLREFSLDKGELRTALGRSTVKPPAGVHLLGNHGNEAFLRCDSKRVILVSIPTNELIVYDLAQNQLTRTPLKSLPENFHINGLALTDSGDIYASTLRGGQGALTGMLHLEQDAQGAHWKSVTMVKAQPGKPFYLLGADGDHLVYSRGRDNATSFWLNPKTGVK